MLESISGLLAWSSSPLGLLGVVAVGMFVLYLGRAAAHEAIRSLTAAIREGLCGCGRLLLGAHERMVARNREVLLAMGRESTERGLEREFARVASVVANALSVYPALNRQISDQIARIDEDYRESTEVPPVPPEWVRAIEPIAAISSAGDSGVERILDDIHTSLLAAQKESMRAYRKSSAERHLLLKRMLPFWRRLTTTLDRVEGTISGLNERARAIDHQMETYEKIRQQSDHAVQALSASSMTQFVASGFVLGIALLGAFINFHLIALPMSEMVGASSYVGPVKTSDVAALVIILTEVAMGLFLLESLRITRLFPVIHSMEDRLRTRMVWASFGLLLTFACIESSLAYMRDILAADREALTQQLAGVAMQENSLRWIPSVGQMLMGFMLPFALSFAAIPLESFIHSARVVGGNVSAVLLRVLASALELIGTFVERLGPMFTHLYDLLIVVPLGVEQLLTRSPEQTPATASPPAARPRRSRRTAQQPDTA